jgi:hypothetical protein
MSRLPITGPPAYGDGSSGKHMKTLRGPDGGRGRGTAQSFLVPDNNGFRPTGPLTQTTSGYEPEVRLFTVDRDERSSGGPYLRCRK